MSPFDWRDFLSFAMRLRTNPGGETAERSAISRAYYACYGVASAWAEADGLIINPTSSRSHATVWLYFKTHADSSLKPIGREGFRLKEYRVRADYQLVYPRVSGEVVIALLAADQLMARLDNLP